MPKKQEEQGYQHLDSLSYFEAALRDALEKSIKEKHDDPDVHVVSRSGSSSGSPGRDH